MNCCGMNFLTWIGCLVITMAKPNLNEQLREDMESMHNGMLQVGHDSTIWQNKLIYAICKSVYDILEWIVRRGT